MSTAKQVTSISAEISCSDASYTVHGHALLDGLNCVFRTGEVSVILGKNGAGKSTLLSLLTKEIEATRGKISLDGRALAEYPFSCLAKLRAVLPQMQTMPFAITVQQLVELGAEVQELPLLTKQIVEAVVEVCDVEHLLVRDVTSLSGGEQKRVQLARVMAQIWPIEKMNAGDKQPFVGRWLFLDEWTNGLDLHHQQQLVQYFRNWAEQGLGVVMVLHDLTLTAQVADQIKILKSGKLAIEGRVEEVITPVHIKQTLDLQITVIRQAGVDYPLVVLS